MIGENASGDIMDNQPTKQEAGSAVSLTDWQRVQLAQLEYYHWEAGQDLLLADGTLIGEVVKVIQTKDGFQATVVRSLNSNNMIVLFRGSSGIRKGDPTTWTNEWLRVNLPIGKAIINQVPDVPQELWTASQQFNQLLSEYPSQTFTIYGHSLGSINAQFALANCTRPKQVGSAYLYEGPNLYWLLDEKQRCRATNLRCHIFNYIDLLDVVALGYIDRQHTIGLLRIVDSIIKTPIEQHMWGGYQFDSNQRLLLKNDTGHNRRAVIDQRLMDTVQQLNFNNDL